MTKFKYLTAVLLPFALIACGSERKDVADDTSHEITVSWSYIAVWFSLSFLVISVVLVLCNKAILPELKTNDDYRGFALFSFVTVLVLLFWKYTVPVILIVGVFLFLLFIVHRLSRK